jgi:ankyrin repeat protein
MILMGNYNSQRTEIQREWMYACFNEKVEYSKNLIEKNQISEPNPLFFCIKNQEIVKLLLDSGISPNLFHEDYGTPLHQAAFSNSPKSLKLLIESGANVFSKDAQGRTAYEVARDFSKYESMGILREEFIKLNFEKEKMNDIEFVCQEEFFDYFENILDQSMVQEFQQIKKKFEKCLKGAFNKDSF